MNASEYKKHVRALKGHAQAMSVDGLQSAIKDEWETPTWPAILFDAMTETLEKKMGKRQFATWFDSLNDEAKS